MEALACSTPVIAASASSLPEAIDHGRNGLLCPPDDADGFAQAVRNLASDTTTWQRMATAARETAERRFSLKRMVGEYLTLAGELADRRGALTTA